LNLFRVLQKKRWDQNYTTPKSGHLLLFKLFIEKYVGCAWDQWYFFAMRHLKYKTCRWLLMADSQSGFHEIAAVIQMLVEGSDMYLVYRPNSKGIISSSSGHLVCVKNMRRWSSCAATVAVYSGNPLDTLALRIKIQSSKKSWRMWTRARCMCPYHHKPFWSSSLCDRYFCGLYHYVLSLKEAGKFLLKFI
jgi:hypothetical protein